MKNRVKRVKEDSIFFYLAHCTIPLSFSSRCTSLCRIRTPLIFFFNLEYLRSDKTFQTRGSIRACILKPMYTNCIIKCYDIKKYFNEIGTTSLHTHIRAYVPRCALGIHVCTYIKDHDTSLPI